MGLLTWIVRKVCPPRVGDALGLGIAVARVGFRCAQTGFKPLLLAERIWIFALERKNGRLCLAYLAVRSAIARYRTEQVVTETVQIVRDPVAVEEEGLTLGDVSSAVSGMQAEQSEERVTHLAAFMYVEMMLSKRAVDASISNMYAMPRGRFDVHSCLKDYFSSVFHTDFEHAIRSALKTGGVVDKEHLEQLRGKIWYNVRTATRDDAIDLFLL